MGEQKDLNGDGTIDGYNWGNIEKEEVFCDYYTMRMIRSARMHYMQLAESYVNKASTLENIPDSTGTNLTLIKEYRQKAVNLLDKQYEVFPIKSCKIDELLNYTAMMYYRARDTAKGFERCTELAEYYNENLAYFAEQNEQYFITMYREIGDFMNHFEALSQGTRNDAFEYANYNPEVYGKLVSKFQSLLAESKGFQETVQSDVFSITQTRRPGAFPITFLEDAAIQYLPDNDRDGVSDFTDQCPRAPGSKDKQGCP